jgi:hypothetical protein
MLCSSPTVMEAMWHTIRPLVTMWGLLLSLKLSKRFVLVWLHRWLYLAFESLVRVPVSSIGWDVALSLHATQTDVNVSVNRLSNIRHRKGNGNQAK